MAITHPVRSSKKLTRVFQALSDVKRLRILRILQAGEHCVCEILDQMDLSQSLLSFHLKVLRESGLVTTRREGRLVVYSLDPARFEELSEKVEDLAGAARNAPERQVRDCP